MTESQDSTDSTRQLTLLDLQGAAAYSPADPREAYPRRSRE